MADGPLLQSRISQNPVLGSLPPALQRKVAEASEVRVYRRSELVARELDRADRLVLVLEGSADICRHSEDGRRTIFRRMHPPAAIGYLLLAGEPHTADVVAGRSLRAALVPVAALREAFREHPAALYKALARLAELVDALSSEILEERTLPLVERVRRAILRNADQHGVLRMSHEELAECVGASRAAVSRAVKRLEAAGDVELGRREIRAGKNS